MIKKLLFFLLIPLMGISQTQIGQDITGDMPDDKFGHGVALSADGSVMAVSAPGNDNNATDTGHIRVYSKTNGTWTQIGQDIEGDNINDQIGYKIALSDDGTTVAFSAVSSKYIINNETHRGYVSIYKIINNTWTKIGQDIRDNDGIYNTKQFGLAISLSGDGSTIAIASPENSYVFDQIQVLKYINGSWQKIGGFTISNNIDIEKFSLYFGWNVSLSGDGTVIAFTDVQGGIKGGTNNSGILYVYKYQLGNWIKVGNTISTTKQNETLGFRVVLSADGSIVAVTTNNGGIGAISVYKNVTNNWVQIGADIEGEAAGDYCSNGLAISANGNALAIGCTGCDTANGADTGKVRIFENIQSNWVEKGSVIGANAGDKIGWSIALSKDGYNLAVGNPGSSSVGGKPYTTNFNEQTVRDNLLQTNNHQAKGTFPGSVQVFNLSGILSSDAFVLENFNIYPNPTTDILHIELDNGLILEKVLIYNTSGQLIKETTEKTINVSSFAKGIYHIQLITDKGKATKKIIVK